MTNMTASVAAKTALEARQLIVTSAAKVVELDFPCDTTQFAEIAGDSRKYGVSVIYRAQEMILVESFRALKRGLSDPKDTFRQRHLVCCFDLTLQPAEEIAAVQLRAVELGDLILPEQVVTSPYTQWAN